MKNVINYYYNLYPENIFQNTSGYYFYINNIRYVFIKYYKDISEINNIYNMHLVMLNHHIYVHPILLNINKSPLTYVDNTPYILMQTAYYDGKITLKEVLNFSKVIVNNDYDNNIAKLWEIKNDYLEYQIRMLGQNHPIISDSFGYFIGLGETAISLMNNIGKNNTSGVCAHNRISNEYTTFDLYNPLNIKIDSKVRDVSEYFKQSFFNNKDINNELTYYLNNVELTAYESILFLSRMIYPTYYFDLFEEIITNREEDAKIIPIINKIDQYEKILKKIYRHYKSNIYITPIEWLQ